MLRLGRITDGMEGPSEKVGRRGGRRELVPAPLRQVVDGRELNVADRTGSSPIRHRLKSVRLPYFEIPWVSFGSTDRPAIGWRNHRRRPGTLVGPAAPSAEENRGLRCLLRTSRRHGRASRRRRQPQPNPWYRRCNRVLVASFVLEVCDRRESGRVRLEVRSARRTAAKDPVDQALDRREGERDGPDFEIQPQKLGVGTAESPSEAPARSSKTVPTSELVGLA